MRKRALKIAVGAALVAALLFGAAYGYHLYMMWDRRRDVLPAFVDPPPGPRAPTTAFLGLEVGKTSEPEAEVVFHGMGLECPNTSIRALMQKKRDDTQQKMAEAEARGEDPDGVTGASAAHYVSKKEQNPQVRLTCSKAPSEAFTDRKRTPGAGHWLIIFDGPKLPLRHTSLQRNFTGDGAQAIAKAEWSAAVDFLTTRFGAPTKLEPPDLTQQEAIAAGGRYHAAWEFSDLKVEVTMFRVGGRIVMQERAEVPWPIRPDAPQLPAR